ncbi:hypothetical protein ElyMa_000042600 [Elysia marginata]|uniref:Uncharacterized protein n=1 Tax=Elysia marginata TaxID=1093978 RepID=A0AAV4EDX2_9GAST|nr:hypothetical protein ElyMa_000042600 [Elysia marginata]
MGFPVQEPTVYRLTSTLPWAFLSKSLLSTAGPACYPGPSGPRAYCLPLTITIPWVFMSKSLLSTATPARYPGLSSPRAYCLPLEQHATLSFRLQGPTVCH